MYKNIIRPLLFVFPPETIHRIVFFILSFFSKFPFFKTLVRRFFLYEKKELEREVFGLRFNAPVGLAAGFDKDAQLASFWEHLGFSFAEIGTLTPQAQPGNPRPRVFRLKKDKAIINRMGFNNRGVEAAIKKLKKRNKKTSFILGGNIGKNTSTPNAEANKDYAFCFEKLYPFADYLTINISCPNIKNLRDLEDKDDLLDLLKILTEIRRKQKQYKPILLKISPDIDQKTLDDTILAAQLAGIDGFVATNTTTDRSDLKASFAEIRKIGNGGLSGKPLQKTSTEIIRYIHDKTNGEMPIIGVGGILSVQDALEKLEAGAVLLQIYSGFIYEGPGLVKRINQAIYKKQIK
ncbi:MAG: dihydroorotate dehydrogenase (quinone) [Bacteroidia bacterium]|nr:MAG: dihydroorotate dehydrogenase (quinone) [Bacteroidia bacterium]